MKILLAVVLLAVFTSPAIAVDFCTLSPPECVAAFSGTSTDSDANDAAALVLSRAAQYTGGMTPLEGYENEELQVVSQLNKALVVLKLVQEVNFKKNRVCLSPKLPLKYFIKILVLLS